MKVGTMCPVTEEPDSARRLVFINNSHGLEEIRTPDLRRVSCDSDTIKPYFSKKDLYKALSETIKELDQNNLTKPKARSNLANLELKFTQEEFYPFIDHSKIGLSKKSHDWITRAAYTTWKHTKGTISRELAVRYLTSS